MSLLGVDQVFTVQGAADGEAEPEVREGGRPRESAGFMPEGGMAGVPAGSTAVGPD